MMLIIKIFIISYLTNLSFQSINNTLACTSIYYSSEKGCTVAPWEGNKRCCYINYIENGRNNGECVFIDDTEKALEAKIKEYSKDKSKVKIECNAHYIQWNYNFVFIAFLVFFSFFY